MKFVGVFSKEEKSFIKRSFFKAIKIFNEELKMKVSSYSLESIKINKLDKEEFNLKCRIPAEMFVEGNNLFLSELSMKSDLDNLLIHEFVHIFLNLINPNISFWLSEGVALFLAKNKLKSCDIKDLEELKVNFQYDMRDYYSSYLYFKHIVNNAPRLVEKLIKGEVDVEILKEELKV